MTTLIGAQPQGHFGRARAALWLIVLLAGILRIVGLNHFPPPLNQDEASRGYDAWALLQTGADRHGAPWPFFLRSFGPGDYTAALSTYLTMPFVAVLGPTPTAMRLPSALLSVCSVMLLYVLVQSRLGERAALAAAAILALDPWHIGLTRTAHEAGFAPFFLLLGLVGLNRAGLLDNEKPSSESSSHGRRQSFSPDKLERRERLVAAIVCGLSLAMHAWIYPATRLFTPLFLLAVAFIYRKPLARNFADPSTRMLPMTAIASLIIGAAPLWLTALQHPDQLAARAETALLPFDSGMVDWIRRVIVNYGLNLSARDLFFQTDDLSGVAMSHIGKHLPIMAPLFGLGMIALFLRLRHDLGAQLVLAWFLLCPLPAAICRDWNPHPMRTVAGVALFPIICAVGVETLARWCEKRRTVSAPRWAAVGFFLLLLNASYAAKEYVRVFSSYGAAGYQAALLEAIRYAARNSDQADFILVTNRCIQPHIYALLEQPIPPNELALLDTTTVPGRLRFDEVLHVGRYFFAPNDPAEPAEAIRAFQSAWSAVPANAQGLVIAHSSEGGVGRMLKSFRNADSVGAEDDYQVWASVKSAINP